MIHFRFRRATACVARAIGLLLLGTSALGSRVVYAQSSPMVMQPMTDPLGLPMSRMGSGTAWLPDSAPMYGVMRNAGSWMFMLHGTAFVQQIWQGSKQGDQQFGSINWGMVNAMRAVGGGRLQLRAMASLDPFTVGGRGYPLLQQTGEQYRGEPIHDRQHPHDLFMEVAASYERALLPDLGLQLYAGAVGEPALGPTAFLHRPAAAGLPLATIAHHWEDATHVSFGVTTVGLYTRRVKLEASAFNGREPDDVRTNFDLRGAKLDAVSVRVSANPTPNVSMQVSGARIPDAEQDHPGEALRRGTASALWSHSLASGRTRSISAIVGANAEGHEKWTQSLTLEGQHDLTTRWAVFTRAEVIRRPSEFGITVTPDAVVPSDGARLVRQSPFADNRTDYSYAMQGSLGVTREVQLARAGLLSVGALATINRVRLEDVPLYGSRTPLGAVVYVRWRTTRMAMGGGVAGMHH